MALKTPLSSLFKNNNQLVPCWIAGKVQRKTSKKHFGKCITRNDVNTVDVVDCCAIIATIIDKPISGIVNFRDISRLTIGLSHIFSQQVDTLLDETKNLLQKMQNTNFEFDLPVPVASRPPSYTQQSRKLKRRVVTTITTTTITVSKRSRMCTPQLLDEEHIDYFRSMLDEPMSWKTYNDLLEVEEAIHISQTQHTCTSEHSILIKGEKTEIDMNPICNDGFGDSDQFRRKSLGEFLQNKNSLKRKSASSPDILLNKRTREEDNTSVTNDVKSPQTVNLYHEIDSNATIPTHSSPIPSPPPPPSVMAQLKKRKRAHLLKKDESIKKSRKQLIRERHFYAKALKKQKSLKFGNNKTFLFESFRQSHIIPQRLPNVFPPTSEEMRIDNENTLRAIFGEDYSDELVKNILSEMPQAPNLNDTLDNIAAPIILSEPADNAVPQTLEVLATGSNDNNTMYSHEVNNNDNNMYSHTHTCFEKDFDSYRVMMDLLSIWRNNPQIKSIDANRFLKSFPDRIKAALAFNHLLSLSRGGFIMISKKENSLEMDNITLGPESIKLIDHLNLEK